MEIRKAAKEDIAKVAALFDEIHAAEEAGQMTVGWIRNVYPTRKTATDAACRGDLFVQEDNGRTVGAAVINQIQVDGYAKGAWEYPAPEDAVMVLHTLVISPQAAGQGYGTAFVAFYEDYAKAHGCPHLRMDTNEKNAVARRLYKKLGYKEIGIIPTVFNGIPNVGLVLLEKFIG